MISINQNINYIKNADIDKIKWDECIISATNSIIYARSFWLDEMTKWDALVLDDYAAVMPLTYNRKFGFYYLYQPYFTKQLGVFGKNISPELVIQFLKTIPKKFKFWNIDLVENSIDKNLKKVLSNIILKKRRNFFVPLDKNYNELSAGYKRLAKRILKQAYKENIIIHRDQDPAVVIDFYKKNYTYDKNISEKIYTKLKKAITIAFKNKNAFAYLAKTDKGKTIAAYLILKDNKFIYSLLGGSNKTGKETGAFYLLTDAAIKDNAASERIFRFEGSDKKGIAFFNSQFNPISVDYFHLYMNDLPFPINLLK